MSSPSQVDAQRIASQRNLLGPNDQQQISRKYAKVKENEVGGEKFLTTEMGYVIVINKVLFWIYTSIFLILLGGFAYLAYLVYKFYKDWDDQKNKQHDDTKHNGKLYIGYYVTVTITALILAIFFILLIYQIANRSRYTDSDEAILELSKNLTIQSSINRAARNIKTIGGVQLDAERADLDEDVYDAKNKARRGYVDNLRNQTVAPPVYSTNYVNPAYNVEGSQTVTEEPVPPAPGGELTQASPRGYKKKKTTSSKKSKRR